MVDPRWTTRREAHSEISTHSSTPKRQDLEQPRRQAKERLDGFHNGAPNATAEVNRFYRDADRAGFALYRKRISRRPRTGSTATADHQADSSSLSTVAYESVSDTRLASFSKVALRKVSVIAVSCRRRFYGGADSQQGSDST